MSEEELALYVPDVYQKDIYGIDYDRLRDAGITLLTFDIDDTLDDGVINKIEANIPFVRVRMPQEAKRLVGHLKEMGFTVVLVTNAQRELGADACKDVGADSFIARAGKPGTGGFEQAAQLYSTDAKYMAHIGNSMREDIVGGNRFGLTTCLVRRVGPTVEMLKAMARPFGIRTKGQVIRKELLDKGMWRKHHMRTPGDQYYQLGERPRYLIET